MKPIVLWGIVVGTVLLANPAFSALAPASYRKCEIKDFDSKKVNLLCGYGGKIVLPREALRQEESLRPGQTRVIPFFDAIREPASGSSVKKGERR